MKFPNYKGLSQETSVKLAKARLDVIERLKLAEQENRAELIGNVHFMEQETSFVAVKTFGRYTSAAPTLETIDEDSAGTVMAHAKIEDPFGDGTPIQSPFLGVDYISLPLDDLEGKTAYYHGYYQPGNQYRKNMEWGTFDPPIAHVKIPNWYRSYRCNIPGNSSFDRNAFIYYASHADFNISATRSHAIWFYPTAIASTAEVFTFLQWRYIDASNWYAVVYETASPNHVLVFVNEAGTITKREVNQAISFNTWNLVFWSYNPSTNALVFKHNNVADSITPSDTLTVPYTTDTNMYIGSLPNLTDKRIEGWLGLYVMWNQIITSVQMTSMWSNGTVGP